MLCPHCGKEINLNALFCGACGKKLDTVNSPSLISKEQIPKTDLLKIDKKKLITFILYLVLIGLYIGISVLLFNLINTIKALTAVSIFDSNITSDFALGELLSVLLNGNGLFNPTTISTALALGFYLLLYSVPVFFGFAIISLIFDKRTSFFNISATIIVFTLALFTIVITPISLKIIPNLIQAFSLNIGMIFSDIKKITFIPLVLYSLLVMVMDIGTIILIKAIQKRRAK